MRIIAAVLFLVMTGCADESGPFPRYQVVEGIVRVPAAMIVQIPDFPGGTTSAKWYKLPSPDDIVVDFTPSDHCKGLVEAPAGKLVTLFTMNENGERKDAIAETPTLSGGYFFFILDPYYYRKVLGIGLGKAPDLLLVGHITDPTKVQLEPYSEFVLLAINRILLGKTTGLSQMTWNSTTKIKELSDSLAALKLFQDLDCSKLPATDLKETVIALFDKALFGEQPLQPLIDFIDKNATSNITDLIKAKPKVLASVSMAGAFDAFAFEELVHDPGKGALVGTLKRDSGKTGAFDKYELQDGVTIKLVSEDTTTVFAEQKTGPRGIFAFKNLNPAYYILTIDTGKIPTNTPAVAVSPDKVTDMREIILPRSIGD